jgi:uncharacterized protein
MADESKQDPGNVVPLRSRTRARACPICRRPTEERWRPFCSKRCADLDLARWLGDRYRVPGDEPAPDADSEDDGR